MNSWTEFNLTMLTDERLAGRPLGCELPGEKAGRDGLRVPPCRSFWSISSQKLSEAHRPVTRQNCFLIIIFPAE